MLLFWPFTFPIISITVIFSLCLDDYEKIRIRNQFRNTKDLKNSHFVVLIDGGELCFVVEEN